MTRIKQHEFKAAFYRHGGRMSAIARDLGISRQHAYRLARAFQVPPPFSPEKILLPLPEGGRAWERVTHVIDGIFGPLPRTEAVIAAADYGTRVHEMVQDLLNGLEPAGDPGELAVARAAEEVIKGVAGDNPVYTEVPLWSSAQAIRGTADIIIFRPFEHPAIDAEAIVVDLKTGSPSSRHHLQQAAYAELLREMASARNYNVETKAYLLYVDRDAHVSLRPTASFADRQAWRAAVTLHRWTEVKR